MSKNRHRFNIMTRSQLIKIEKNQPISNGMIINPNQIELS